MTQEEALEAAKLAAMVGGQLKAIDKHYVERRNMPANRIDINSFIDQVKDPHHKTPMAPYLANTPQGFAPPPPEEFIQAQVPDTVSPFVPELPTMVSEIKTQDVSVAAPSNNIPSYQPAIMGHNSMALTPNEIQLEISSTLKSIDKTLSDMLSYMKENIFR